MSKQYHKENGRLLIFFEKRDERSINIRVECETVGNAGISTQDGCDTCEMAEYSIHELGDSFR
jgi:hypothetical protein